MVMLQMSHFMQYYNITDSGRAIQKEQEDEWRNFSTAINKILDGEEQL